jgi:peroxiredoxin family protein
MAEPGPVAIFLHRGEYDVVHQGLSIAAATVSMGRRAEVYFFWWALERLVRGELDEPDLERDDVNATMELRGVPTLRQLLDVVRDSGLGQVFACSGSMAAIGLTPPDVEPRVDALVGWTSILKRTHGVVDRFYL